MIKLNIEERVILINVLPAKGNFETMSTIERLKDKLFPTAEEVKKFGVSQTDTAITWNAEGAIGTDISMSDVQLGFLLAQLNNLSDKEELNFAQFYIMKKIKDCLTVDQIEG